MATTPGRKYSRSQAQRLIPDSRPVPFEPYAINAPAKRVGQGLKRVAPDGSPWCPFCWRTLVSGERACKVHQPLRNNAVRNRPKQPHRRRRGPVPAAADRQYRDLMAAVDDMTLWVGKASGQLNHGELTTSLLNKWFHACKRVDVLATALDKSIRASRGR